MLWLNMPLLAPALPKSLLMPVRYIILIPQKGLYWTYWAILIPTHSVAVNGGGVINHQSGVHPCLAPLAELECYSFILFPIPSQVNKPPETLLSTGALPIQGFAYLLLLSSVYYHPDWASKGLTHGSTLLDIFTWYRYTALSLLTEHLASEGHYSFIVCVLVLCQQVSHALFKWFCVVPNLGDHIPWVYFLGVHTLFWYWINTFFGN